MAAICQPLETPAHMERVSQWYAVYTCVRHEKRVAEQLASRHVDFYLPLYTTVHYWNQRKAQVELPLFPGYLFVRISLADRLRVLTIPSVVHLVSSGGIPAPLSDDEIEILRKSLAAYKAEPYPYLQAGQRVRVNTGPLQGLEGVIVRNKGKWRMVVSVDCIAKSIALEVDATDLELAGLSMSSPASERISATVI
jgi:transcription antitermination factor NusG